VLPLVWVGGAESCCPALLAQLGVTRVLSLDTEPPAVLPTLIQHVHLQACFLSTLLPPSPNPVFVKEPCVITPSAWLCSTGGPAFERVWFRTATTTLNYFDIWSFLLAHLHHIFMHLFHTMQPKRYTHKTSGFKTSGFKTSGFKTSETSGLQNVRFTKRHVYKMSGLQNVRFTKRQVEKNHPYIFFTCGWWKSAGSVAAMFAGNVMAVFYSLF
jgi:hypothetical protein